MMLEDMIEYRRALHCIPELENHLPKTCAFVKAQLQGLRVYGHRADRGGGLRLFLTRERRILWRSGRIWMHCPSPSRPACPFPLSTGEDARLRPRRAHCHAAGIGKNCGGAARNAAVQCAAGVSAGGGESRRRATAVPQRHLCALSCPGDFWFPFVAGAAAGRNCHPSRCADGQKQ